jgi:hypothetical protein
VVIIGSDVRPNRQERSAAMPGRAARSAGYMRLHAAYVGYRTKSRNKGCTTERS